MPESTYSSQYRTSQHDYDAPILGEGPETVAAGAAVVQVSFEILKSVISPFTVGDVSVTGPNTPIGVTLASKPANLRLRALSSERLIIDWRESNPITGFEQVNIKMRCFVQYNGPEVTASFGFDADGRRSRTGRDTTIYINNPLSLETRPAPDEWKRVGVDEYPVIYIPIEFRVDRPWPMSNYNQTFKLVLCGMVGFGSGVNDRTFKKDVRIVYN
jgi:hypothetical protein